jgi:diguanylate cyclase (GGDEF)-like protein
VEILTERPNLSLVSGGVLSREECAILEMTPAAITILARGPDGISAVASNERYERIFCGSPPPPELIEQVRVCLETGVESACELDCETSIAIRYVRFRMQPMGKGRVVCVAEDITVSRENAREVTRQRELLRNAAPIDPLTGTMGRRRFMEDARLQLKRAHRHDIGISLALVDMDRFQELNDAFGCEAGDSALCAVADVFRAGLRDTDLIARIGGDEFALLLLHTDGQHGRIVTDRLRETVTIRSGMFQGSGALSISIGVVEMHTRESLEDLIDRAEAALGIAKASGRNRVVLG